MRIISLATLIVLLLLSCHCSKEEHSESSIAQEEIIDKYLRNGAWKHHFLTKEWDQWIDKAIQTDSTIAYLWQQKALPFWKQKKYSQAISYYDKAVILERRKWLSRLGYLKCIFAKDYLSALDDLQAYKSEFGISYEQDHSIDLYIGICYLQLNQYDLASEILLENTTAQEKQYGEDWVPYLDRFYLAIAHYEQGEYVMAVTQFNLVLQAYPDFSDAQFYKSLCLKRLGQHRDATNTMEKGKANFLSGFTIDEDSSKYEDYPYQVTWQWESIDSILK